MSYDWPTFLASIGGSAVVGLGAAYAIVQTFFKKKIEAEVQSKYDEALANLNAKNSQELECFKAAYKKSLDENQIRFSKLYAEKADAIKELYKRMVKLNDYLLELTFPGLPESIENKEEYLAKQSKNTFYTYNDCKNYFSINEILLSRKLCTKLSYFFDKSDNAIFNHGMASRYKGVKSEILKQEAEKCYIEAYNIAHNELKSILEELKADFRAILNGEEVQDAE